MWGEEDQPTDFMGFDVSDQSEPPPPSSTTSKKVDRTILMALDVECDNDHELTYKPIADASERYCDMCCEVLGENKAEFYVCHQCEWSICNRCLSTKYDHDIKQQLNHAAKKAKQKDQTSEEQTRLYNNKNKNVETPAPMPLLSLPKQAEQIENDPWGMQRQNSSEIHDPITNTNTKVEEETTPTSDIWGTKPTPVDTNPGVDAWDQSNSEIIDPLIDEYSKYNPDQKSKVIDDLGGHLIWNDMSWETRMTHVKERYPTPSSKYRQPEEVRLRIEQERIEYDQKIAANQKAADKRAAEKLKLKQEQEEFKKKEIEFKKKEIEKKNQEIERQRQQRLNNEKIAKEKKLEQDMLELKRLQEKEKQDELERFEKEEEIRKKKQLRYEKEKKLKEIKRLKALENKSEQPLHQFLQEMGIAPPSLGKHNSNDPPVEIARVRRRRAAPGAPKHNPTFISQQLSPDDSTVKAAAAAMANRVFASLDELKKRDLIVEELQQQLQQAMAQVARSNANTATEYDEEYDKVGKYLSERERASRNGSTVVDISIPPPSFKPVALSLSRSSLFYKHPNKSFLTQ